MLQNLSCEAQVLAPVLEVGDMLHRDGLLSDCDYVGVYILCYSSLRRPRGWVNGKFKVPISTELRLSTGCVTAPHSARLSAVSGLLDILHPEYIARVMCIPTSKCGSITILSLFDNLRLSAVKKNVDNYVNKCMVSWAYGCRPFVLMHRVPSPMEVLRQQAQAERVVTMFITESDLSKKHTAMLHYMDGHQDHSRDAFEFLLHDLKHMENFVDPQIHAEQVGFFRCMMRLSKSAAEMLETARGNGLAITVEATAGGSQVVSTGKRSEETPAAIDTCATKEDNAGTFTKCRPKGFFTQYCGYDEQLWLELEYVISDMNCFSTHLMQYLMSKMLIATKRQVNTILETYSHLSSSAEMFSALLKLFPSRTRDTEQDTVRDDSFLSHSLESGDVDSIVRSLMMYRWKVMLLLFGMKDEELEGSACYNIITHSAALPADLAGDESAHPPAPSSSHFELTSEENALGDKEEEHWTAYSACVGLLETAFKQRGPMTAAQGEAIRDFFRSQAADSSL